MSFLITEINVAMVTKVATPEQFGENFESKHLCGIFCAKFVLT